MANVKDKITSTIVGDTLRNAVHKIDELGEQVAKKGDKVIHQGQKTMEQYTDDVTAYIKNAPIKSLLVAIGLGLLLGRFLK